MRRRGGRESGTGSRVTGRAVTWSHVTSHTSSPSYRLYNQSPIRSIRLDPDSDCEAFLSVSASRRDVPHAAVKLHNGDDLDSCWLSSHGALHCTRRPSVALEKFIKQRR